MRRQASSTFAPGKGFHLTLVTRGVNPLHLQLPSVLRPPFICLLILPPSPLSTSPSPQAISSTMEDRPTTATVRHMVESASMDSAERVSGALVPMWESVKGLQGGVRDLQAEVKGALKEVAGVVQQQVGGAAWQDHRRRWERGLW